MNIFRKKALFGGVQSDATLINGAAIIRLRLTMFLSHDDVIRLT